MKLFSSKKRVVASLAVAATVLGGGGAALAYWTSTGSGSGSATSAATVGTVTLTQTSAAPTDLSPSNATASVLKGKVTFSGGGKVYIGTVTPTIDSAHTTWQTDGTYTCSAADYTLAAGTAINTDEASGTDNLPFGTIVFNDKSLTDQSACKSQALVLSFTSN